MPELYDGTQTIDLTVVLPAWNESAALRSVIEEVRRGLQIWSGNWEILVVDDGSTDETAAAAQTAGARVVRRVERGGYGSAVKTGFEHARGVLVALLDADGSYPGDALPQLLAFVPGYDQVSGARISEQGSTKLLRVPAKWLIRKLAEWVSAKRIPDLNTGMKVVKRELMLRYLWAIPDGFSCTTSMTLAFLCNGHPVKYVPVAYRRRIGKSKFRPIHDTANYIATIVRVITYFRPLRVFLPLAALLGLIALVTGTIHAMTSPLGISDSDIFLSLTAVIMLALGLIAEIVVARSRAG